MNAPPTADQLNEFRQFAADLARSAGKLLQDARDHAKSTSERKSTPTDLVTQADHASERLLFDMISDRYNTHGIFGEEGACKKGEGDYRWVIDPLDGTLNYVRGLGHFGTIVSLEHRGIPVASASYDIPHDRMWTAAWKQGVTLNDSPVHTSDTSTLDSSVIIIEGATGKHAQQTRLDIQKSLMSNIGATRQLGCAATEFGLVASGITDALYINGCGRWDVSAGVLLVREAGGNAVVKQDEHGRYTAVAANAHLFDEFCERVNFTDGSEFTVPS